MTSILRLLTVGALVSLGFPALAASSVSLEWSDLPDPSVQEFEDPFRDLSPEQFDDLQFAVRLRWRLEQDVGTSEERQKWQEMLVETEEALAADHIDIDWMLSQREVVIERRNMAYSAGNPAFDDQIVTLAGYAIPAPPDEQGRPVAYLVPQPGMCSHLPPPPPNKMIRVLLTEDWTPSYFHEPVRLTGRLIISPTDYEMNVVDGLMPMHATFVMDAETAEPLANDPQSRANAERLAERLRAAIHRKSGGVQPEN